MIVWFLIAVGAAVIIVVLVARARSNVEIAPFHSEAGNSPPGVVPPSLVLNEPGINVPTTFGAAKLDDDVLQLARQGQLINAIKLLRDRTGIGLREAKDAVEAAVGRVNTELQADVAQLARAGEKISAIKLFREQTGLGLAEAKEAVEQFMRNPGAQQVQAVVSQQSLEITDAAIERELRAGRKIEAIKLYRTKTGTGLKEAKDAIDAWHQRLR